MIAVLFLLALLLEWHILDVVDVNPVSSLMNFEFLQTLHGFINLLQVSSAIHIPVSSNIPNCTADCFCTISNQCFDKQRSSAMCASLPAVHTPSSTWDMEVHVLTCFGFAAIFSSSFIWVDTNVFFQFIYKGLGWQTLVLFILVVTFIFALTILISNIFGKDVLGSIGKKRVIDSGTSEGEDLFLPTAPALCVWNQNVMALLFLHIKKRTLVQPKWKDFYDPSNSAKHPWFFSAFGFYFTNCYRFITPYQSISRQLKKCSIQTALYEWNSQLKFPKMLIISSFVRKKSQEGIYRTTAHTFFILPQLLLLYAICLVSLIVSASLESWYIGLTAGHLHARFIAVTVFNWLLVISYIVLLVVTILFV